MQSQARCANHPDRAAAIACARCGTFVCSACVVSGDLCTTCKSRLFREGVPYSDQEKARASARRCLRTGTWLLRLLFAVGGAGLMVVAAPAAGLGPAVLERVGWALVGLAAIFGLAAAGFGGLGFLRSTQGRPGPAVEGVFPGSTALMMVLAGLAPLVLVLFALTRPSV
jgi:hypothetical protein